MFQMYVMQSSLASNLQRKMQESFISANPVIWNSLIPASAGAALQKAFHAVPGEAFGFMAGSPAAIGLVMADTAMKASAVNITCYMTPSIGTSHSNEVILGISGDASAVKAAVLEARQVGLELLIGMGSYPEIPGTPYL